MWPVYLLYLPTIFSHTKHPTIHGFHGSVYHFVRPHGIPHGAPPDLEGRKVLASDPLHPWNIMRQSQFLLGFHFGAMPTWSITGWWLNQPIWKICASQIGWTSSPKRDEHKTCLSCHHLDNHTQPWKGPWNKAVWKKWKHEFATKYWGNPQKFSQV